MELNEFIPLNLRLNYVGEEKKRFLCKFINPGLVSYAEQKNGGIELLRKETIDAAKGSFEGCPLQVRHDDPTVHGKVEKVYFNDADGWYYAEGTVETDEARKAIDKGYKVSCGYRVNSLKPGGKFNNIDFKQEIASITFDHMALVTKPRYQESGIRWNGLKEWFVKKLGLGEDAESDIEIEVNGKSIKLNDLVASYVKHNTDELPAVKAHEDHPEGELPEKVEPKAEPVLEETKEVTLEKGKEGSPVAAQGEPESGKSEPAPSAAPSDPMNLTQLTDSPQTQAGTKSQECKDKVKVEEILSKWIPIKINNISDTFPATVEAPAADRKLDDKALGLKYYNDLRTAKSRYVEAVSVKSVDTGSVEHQLALGKKLY